MNVTQAIQHGQLTINLPVAAIMFGPWALNWLIFETVARHYKVPAPVLDICLAFGLFSIPLAWLYWSCAVPRWKLWAYKRVNDVQALKSAAIGSGLIWPDGHLFEKTEICSKAMRQKILKLEGRL